MILRGNINLFLTAVWKVSLNLWVASRSKIYPNRQTTNCRSSNGPKPLKNYLHNLEMVYKCVLERYTWSGSKNRNHFKTQLVNDGYQVLLNYPVPLQVILKSNSNSLIIKNMNWEIFVTNTGYNHRRGWWWRG